MIMAQHFSGRLLSFLVGLMWILSSCAPRIELQQAQARPVYQGTAREADDKRYYIQLEKKRGQPIRIGQVWIGNAQEGRAARYALQKGDRVITHDSLLTDMKAFTIQARPDPYVEKSCVDPDFEGSALVEIKDLKGRTRLIKISEFQDWDP